MDTALGIALIAVVAVLAGFAVWDAIKKGQTGPQFGLSFKLRPSEVPVRKERTPLH